MADFDFQAGVRSDGSEAELAAAITSSLKRAFDKMGPELGKSLASDFKKAFSGGQMNDVFDEATKGAKDLGDAMRGLTDRLSDLASASAAQRKSFGDGFDPSVLDAFESSLDQIIKLQDEITKKGGDPGLERQFSQRANLIRSELTSTRTAAQQSTLAFREAANAQARDANQASRERISSKRAETARFVTETQTGAARELAIIRTNAQQAVATTQAAAKRRAATFALVATAVRSSERVIRATFENTARVASAALSGITKTASSVANGLGSAFRRGNRSVVNNFNESSSQITSSYSKSWRKNTNIVNNELGNQSKGIKRFAEEASSSIGGISIGKLGGFAALGGLAAKALTSGFQRAATLEDSERALTTLLGSAEQAVELREQVLKVVTGTPFALDQFADAATQLVAFNVEAERVPKILQAIADGAAVRGGSSGQTIDTLVNVFGQITTAGRIMGDDINRISEAGVPALQILGNAYGKTIADMKDMVSDGAVPANEAIDILTQGIIEGTQGVNGATAAFGGLAQSLGGTLRGSIGNFNAAFARLGATLITKFQPILVDTVTAATKFVDVISKVLASLGDAVTRSPVFAVIGKVFARLGSQIQAAGDKLKPVFDFLAEGLVTFGTAAGALAGLRRIPLLFSAITFAARRLLAPMNLLVGAGILVAGFISKLVRESPDLSAAFQKLGQSIGRIFGIVKDLATDGFNALAEVLDNVITPAVGWLAEKIVAVAVPALERLNNFIVDSVIPVVSRFARFVRAEVVPVVADLLSRGLGIATDAFGRLVDFIRKEVVPVVGPILGRAVDLGRAAFEKIYGFLSGTLVPFIRSNLTPVLTGLGAALGVLALTGGNIPLAGLVGAGAGIGALLTNDETRNRIADFFGEIVDTIRGKFKDLFDGVTIQGVLVGALKLVRGIGRTLGNIASDPRLLAAVAAIAAVAASVAAAFVTGFVEGVLSNVPEIAEGINAAITKAAVAGLKAAASNPVLGAAAIALFGGALFLRHVVTAGRAAAAEFARAASLGPGSSFRPQGGTATSFVQSLIGGPNAIARNVEAQFKAAQAVTISEGQRLQRIAQQTTGSTIRSPGGQFLKKTDAAAIARGYDEIARAVGPANLAAGQLRAGIGQVSDAFRKGQPFLTNFKDGLRSIGDGAKGALRQFGSTVGIAAGAAFAGAFLAKAAFDVESTGTQKLQGVVGALGAGLTAGVLTGSAGVGAGVAAFSLLGGAIIASREQTERLKQSIKDLGRELTNLAPDEAGEVIDKTVLDAFLDASTSVKETLIDLGIAYEDFASAAASGQGVDLIAKQFEGFGPAGDIFAASIRSGEISLGRIDDAIRDANSTALQFRRELEDSGVNVDDFADTTGLLGETLKLVSGSIKEAATNSTLLGTSADRTGRGMDFLRERTALNAAAADVAADATKAFKDRVDELNEARIDGLERQVDAARGALDDAGRAADEAKERVAAFLRGDTATKGLQTQVDEATIAVARTAEGLANLGEGASTAAGAVGAEFRLALDEVATQASNLLVNNPPVDAASARALLQPLIDEAGGAGTEVGDAVIATLDAVLQRYSTGDGGKNTKGLSAGILAKAQDDIKAAQAELAKAENDLTVGLAIDPLAIPDIIAEATTAFTEAGKASSDGYVAGFDSESMQTAASEAAAAAIAAAKSALGISSPSTAFAALGRFSAQGYIQGITSASGLIFNATRRIGQFAMDGFRQGVVAGGASVVAAARSIANQAAQVMRDALKVESPSRVTMEIGNFFGEGLAEGISNSASRVILASVRVARAALHPLNQSGREAAMAIGKGFAEGGPDFLGSVGSAMDKAYNAALTKAQKFKVIGREIASNLFSNQGTSPEGIFAGGTASARFAVAGINALGIAGAFAANTQKLFEADRQAATDAGDSKLAFRSITFDLKDEIGRANQAEFLEAGLKIRDYSEELIAAGVGLDQVTATTQALRDQLIAAANARGLDSWINAGIGEQMIRSLGLADDQLASFVQQVGAVEAAARAATEAEERRIDAEKAAEAAAERAEEARKAAEEAAKVAEEAERKRADDARAAEERARREYTLPGPTFRDLIIQSPSGDPEAVALAAANRVAFAIRR